MQPEDFEKEVKQKMEALSFAPSEPVWPKIEKEIAAKKERKKVFFWLLSFLMAGITIWGVLNYKGQHKTNVEPTENSVINTEKKIKNALVKVENKPEDKASNTKVVQQVPTKNSPIKSVDKQIVKTSTINNRSPLSKSTTSVKNKIPTKGFKKVSDKKDKPVVQIIPKNDNNLDGRNNAIDKYKDVTKDNEIVNEDSTLVPSLIKEDSIKTDTVLTVKNNRKRWLYGGGFTVASSGISTSAFNFSSPASAQFLYDAPPLQSSGGSASRPASALKNGVSYSIYFHATKNLYKQVGLSTGFRYSYYSTSIETGQKLRSDTTIFRNANALQLSAYYRNNNGNHQYKNQYHFIELPVGLSFYLLKNNKLIIEPGISVGYLLYTNALYYNQQAQIYYSDASVYNKTTLSLFTQATYTVAKLKKAAIAVGPSAQFTLSNFVNNQSKGKQHLYRAGLTTKIIFE